MELVRISTPFWIVLTIYDRNQGLMYACLNRFIQLFEHLVSYLCSFFQSYLYNQIRVFSWPKMDVYDQAFFPFQSWRLLRSFHALSKISQRLYGSLLEFVAAEISRTPWSI